jgi:hypothetical protein
MKQSSRWFPSAMSFITGCFSSRLIQQQRHLRFPFRSYEYRQRSRSLLTPRLWFTCLQPNSKLLVAGKAGSGDHRQAQATEWLFTKCVS